MHQEIPLKGWVITQSTLPSAQVREPPTTTCPEHPENPRDFLSSPQGSKPKQNENITQSKDDLGQYDQSWFNRNSSDWYSIFFIDWINAIDIMAIGESGSICIELLKGSWDTESILTSMSSAPDTEQLFSIHQLKDKCSSILENKLAAFNYSPMELISFHGNFSQTNCINVTSVCRLRVYQILSRAD